MVYLSFGLNVLRLLERWDTLKAKACHISKIKFFSISALKLWSCNLVFWGLALMAPTGLNVRSIAAESLCT